MPSIVLVIYESFEKTKRILHENLMAACYLLIMQHFNLRFKSK